MRKNRKNRYRAKKKKNPNLPLRAPAKFRDKEVLKNVSIIIPPSLESNHQLPASISSFVNISLPLKNNKRRDRKRRKKSKKDINIHTQALARENSSTTTVLIESTTRCCEEHTPSNRKSAFDRGSLPDYLRHRDRRQLTGGGGIIQAPLLSACKPGAKRDYNYKCRPKFIPQDRNRRDSDSSEENTDPTPPRIKCPEVG